jgi:hypothetical protein
VRWLERPRYADRGPSRGRSRLLLTGDGRGDHTLEGLKSAGLLDQSGKLHLDVLKCPHQGSIRNVEKQYFEKIVADHYVISADGKFDNPDGATLELIPPRGRTASSRFTRRTRSTSSRSRPSERASRSFSTRTAPQDGSTR